MSDKEKVIEIFKDYYGEDRIDVQGNTIMIHWPEVTVTNENDRSTIIKELYAKIGVDSEGKLVGTFTLNRSEYTCVEWYNDYMHSHVRSIPKERPYFFQSSCLGSGPIKDTSSYLNANFSEEMWMMFALELDKYVHTESVAGVPYHYMERMNMLPETGYNEVTVPLYSAPQTIPLSLWDYMPSFIRYMIGKRAFGFTFSGRYSINMPSYNVIITMSNLLIEWFNGLDMNNTEKRELLDRMFDTMFLIRCKADGTSIKEFIKQIPDYETYRNADGTELWEFKGNRLYLRITGIPTDEEIEESYRNLDTDSNTSYVIRPCFVSYIIDRILRIVNYEYGKTEEINRPDKRVYQI